MWKTTKYIKIWEEMKENMCLHQIYLIYLLNLIGACILIFHFQIKRNTLILFLDKAELNMILPKKTLLSKTTHTLTQYLANQINISLISKIEISFLQTAFVWITVKVIHLLRGISQGISMITLRYKLGLAIRIEWMRLEMELYVLIKLL